jgi:hypothetical protein
MELPAMITMAQKFCISTSAARKALAKDVGEEIVSRLSGLLDAYAVVSDGGSIITVGHRFKRVKEN